jgi:hypothetical protein
MKTINLNLHLVTGQVLTLSYTLGDSFSLTQVQEEIDVVKTFSEVQFLRVYIPGETTDEQFVIHEWDKEVSDH